MVFTAWPSIVTVNGFIVVRAVIFEGRPISTPCMKIRFCGALESCVKRAARVAEALPVAGSSGMLSSGANMRE